MDGGPGDAVEFCEFAQAHAGGAVTENAGAIDLDRLAADVPAFEAGPAHAGAHALYYKVALELGDGADDDHHGPAERPAGVDVLAEADELDR